MENRPNVVLITTDENEGIADITASTDTVVSFIRRHDIDTDAPHYVDNVLGSPAMLTANYTANVAPVDDAHAAWLKLSAMNEIVE